MRSLEDGLVIKLGVVGQSQTLPASGEVREHGFGADALFWPRIGLACPQRNAGEHLYQWPGGDLQVFNPVKAVQFGPPRCQRRQIPALRRRWAAQPAGAIEHAMTRQDAVNGGSRRHIALLGLELGFDRARSVFAQHAALAQLAPNPQNMVLQLSGGAIPCATGLAVSEPRAIQTLAADTPNPPANHRGRHVKLPRHRVHRTTLSNQSNHAQPSLLDTLFYSCSAPQKHQGYSYVLHER